jgi:hypothetical protein
MVLYFLYRMKRLLIQDQDCVSKPDYRKRFNSREDAIQRLLPYHLYQYSNMDAWMKWEESQSQQSLKSLADQCLELYQRYESILKKEASQPVATAVELSLMKHLLASELHELNELRQSLGMPILNEPSVYGQPSSPVYTTFRPPYK